MIVVKIREIKDEDWPSVKDILFEEYTKKEFKAIKSFAKLKNGKMILAFIDCNLAGCCLTVNGRIKKQVILQDCKRLGIDRKLK